MDNTSFEAFEDVNLEDVAPVIEPLPEDIYPLKLVKAQKRTYQKKDGSGEGSYASFQFVVNGHPKYAGRMIFETMFPGPMFPLACRRLQDATSVQQDGRNLFEFLDEVAQSDETIHARVKVKPGKDRDGNPVDENRIDWQSIEAA